MVKSKNTKKNVKRSRDESKILKGKIASQQKPPEQPRTQPTEGGTHPSQGGSEITVKLPVFIQLIFLEVE